MQRSIVTIGASAGGIEALTDLVANLPHTFPATLFVVVHLSADSPGTLPRMIARASELPTSQAVNEAAILPGHIFVAPPDRHLLVERDRMRVTRAPKENRFRPAVDPLFRSAAYAYGPQTIGVVLSGALDDGTAGLWAIKDRGGVTIVQEPNEAAYPSMPQSALKQVQIDYRLPVKEIAALLLRLVEEPIPEEGAAPVSEAMKIENQIALEDNALAAGVLKLGPLSPYTCPECHGVLVQLQEGNNIRFRCHTGHAFSMESLLGAIAESMDETLWSAVRAFEERMLLLRHMAAHVRQQANEVLAERFEQKAQAAEDRVLILRQLALAKE
ncbi:MAG: chemotaxis protein CheB [Caldilineaceae bacterium]